MRNLTAYLSLGLALWVGLAPAARADRDRDRDRDRAAAAPAPIAYAHAGNSPVPGSCTLGRAERDLDVNNVSARVFNTGSLFYGNGAEHHYYVPQASGRTPFYATGIWIGGRVGGELRVAGSTYDRYEFWPGPLNYEDGTLPNSSDCTAYDRIFRVSVQDILNYEGTGVAAQDLAQWPVQWGAPVLAAPDNGIDDDGDGEIDERGELVTPEGRLGLAPGSYGLAELEARRGELYNLAAGDRPHIIGDMGLWWVMNDLGNNHQKTLTPPIGVEVQVLAWAFARADALNDVTFYRYRVIKRTPDNLTDTYLSLFSDPDLGDATDDYVGADVELGLGYVYNADNQDGNGTPPSYGLNPPAGGYDFFQGPIVDLDGDGIRSDTLGMTRFMYFSNIGGTDPTSDPSNGPEMYNYMSGLWRDGTTMTIGGTGYGNPTGTVTTFAYPGDPVTGQFWSEVCPNQPACGSATPPGDRRFVMGTGPFILEPNIPQDIVFGIVFGQGSNHLTSIDALRAADRLAQNAYNANFELAAAPPPPPLCDRDSPNPELRPGSGGCFEAVELDRSVVLRWGYPSNSPNYLGTYEVVDRLLEGTGAADETYNFEGFNIYRFTNSDFSNETRELIATFDIINGVTTVIDTRFDPATGMQAPFVAARGADTGLRYSLELPNLTNYTDYFYGITAYAYNEESVPKVIESAVRQITVRPSRLTASGGGSSSPTTPGSVISAPRVQGIGAAGLDVRVVDPTAVIRATYRVEVVQITPGAGGEQCQPNADGVAQATCLTYNIYRDGALIVSGAQLYEERGRLFEVGGDVFVVDGLEFFRTNVSQIPADDLTGAPGLSGGGLGVLEVAHPTAAPCGPTVTDSGCTTFGGEGNYVFRNPNVTADYYVSAAGANVTPFSLHNTTATASSAGFAGVSSPFDYEIRFTEAGGYGVYNAFGTAASPKQIVRVPFEVWNVMTTPDDPSDDVRMIPVFTQNATANPLITNWEDTFPTTELRVIAGDSINFPITEQFAALFPDRPNGYDLFEAAAIGFGGAGSTYNPAADGDTQVDTNPFNGQPCNRQGYYIDFCARNDRLTSGQATGFSPAFVRLVFADNAFRSRAGAPETPAMGTVVRIKTVRPLLVGRNPADPASVGDVFEFNTNNIAFVTGDPNALRRALDMIGAVPNPYIGSSAYESGNLDRVIRFINLPEGARIRIYTISGTLIREFQPFDARSGQRNSLDWDLQTQANLPVASGMYLAHIEVPGPNGGERVLRLGIVNRRNQINVF